MNKLIKKSAICLTFALLASAHTVYAQDQDQSESGVYFQGGLASLTYEYGTNYKYDLGTTYAVYAGYNVNKYLAFEVMYA